MKFFVVLVFITYSIKQNCAQEKPCRAQNFGYDSIACVCDINYCDSSNPTLPKEGEYLHVTTNKAGLRFDTVYGVIEELLAENPNNQCLNIINNRTVFLTLDRTKTSQPIIGFGGAITDAVGMNLNRLSPALQDIIIDEFYGPKGLKYNMARTTMGHCDYSPSAYYYNNFSYDINMTNWQLTNQDYDYRIPYIRKAKNATTDEFLLVASLWTVPEWMRENNDFGYRVQLIENYYYSYALYILKYLEAYRKEGIEHWGISYVNEPTLNLGTSVEPEIPLLFQVWNIRQLATFAVEYFIPMLKRDYSNVKILFFDDDRTILQTPFIRYLNACTDLPKYYEYIGLHAYLNKEADPSIVDNFHNEHLNVLIVNTEFSEQIFGPPQLGSWSNAISYAEIMMEEINHYYSGWIEWNLVLNSNGGPHFIQTHTDATIIIDDDNATFYKQPSYYIMGHFSKFIPRGSVKIDLTSVYPTTLMSSAVLRPDGLVTALMWNPTNETIVTILRDETKGNIRAAVSPYSMNTIIF